MMYPKTASNILFFVLMNMAIIGQSMIAMEHTAALSAICTKSIKLYEYKVNNALRKTYHFLKHEAFSIFATALPVVHAFPMNTIIKDINSTFYDYQYTNEPLSEVEEVAIVASGALSFALCVGCVWYGYCMCQHFVHQAVQDSSSEEPEDDTDDEDTIEMIIIGDQSD